MSTTIDAGSIMTITVNGTTGQELRKAMRRVKITIAELAKRMDVTQKSVRAARVNGVRFLVALDFWNGITGESELTPRLRAMLNQYRNQKYGCQ